MNLLEQNLASIRQAQQAGDKGTCIQGGWLEVVLTKPKHAARAPLVWQNLFFGHHRRRRIRLANYQEAGNSPLYLYPEIVDEVAKYIYLPEEVKAAYRELRASRLAGDPDA